MSLDFLVFVYVLGATKVFHVFTLILLYAHDQAVNLLSAFRTFLMGWGYWWWLLFYFRSTCSITVTTNGC